MSFFAIATHLNFNPQNLIFCIMFAVDFFILYPLFAFVKWQKLIKLGFSDRELKAVFSNRRRNFQLEKLIHKYGDKNLRIADGIPRKMLHITSGVLQLLILNLFVDDTYKALQIVVIYQIVLIILSIMSYSSLLIVYLNSLSSRWWVLCLVISIITTVVELIAPRSTDNFLIPVVNGLVCLVFIVRFLPFINITELLAIKRFDQERVLSSIHQKNYQMATTNINKL